MVKSVKIWVDDIRKAPVGYIHCYTTDNAIAEIEHYRSRGVQIEVLDLDNDAGDFVRYGGDYIKILDYMEEHEINDVPIKIHSGNPVGIKNMYRIAKKNNWTVLEDSPLDIII